MVTVTNTKVLTAAGFFFEMGEGLQIANVFSWHQCCNQRNKRFWRIENPYFSQWGEVSFTKHLSDNILVVYGSRPHIKKLEIKAVLVAVSSVRSLNEALELAKRRFFLTYFKQGFKPLGKQVLLETAEHLVEYKRVKKTKAREKAEAGMLASLSKAITNRNHISFEYRYDPSMIRRQVEPYVLGRARSGRILFRGFQISGFSRSRHFSAWKLFALDSISALRILSAKRIFKPRPGYNPVSDKHIPSVISKVVFHKNVKYKPIKV